MAPALPAQPAAHPNAPADLAAYKLDKRVEAAAAAISAEDNQEANNRAEPASLASGGMAGVSPVTASDSELLSWFESCHPQHEDNQRCLPTDPAEVEVQTADAALLGAASQSCIALSAAEAMLTEYEVLSGLSDQPADVAAIAIALAAELNRHSNSTI